MISNKQTFISGEKDLSLTLLVFFIILPFFYILIFYFLNQYVISNNGLFLCNLECNINNFYIVKKSFYSILTSILFFFLLMFYSSFILWKNSNNTNNINNTYSAKFLSFGFGFLFFILSLMLLYSFLVPFEFWNANFFYIITNNYIDLIKYI